MKSLHPNAVWLFFLSHFLRLFILLIFLGYQLFIVLPVMIASGNLFTYSLLSVFAVIFLIFLLYIWSKLSYRFYKYELSENGFRKELGVIYKKYVTIPYDRIQNVDIHRGILARFLGLSDLNIQTAGSASQTSVFMSFSGGAEGRLPGISKEDAEKLRDELIRRTKNSSNQGL